MERSDRLDLPPSLNLDDFGLESCSLVGHDWGGDEEMLKMTPILPLVLLQETDVTCHHPCHVIHVVSCLEVAHEKMAVTDKIDAELFYPRADRRLGSY